MVELRQQTATVYNTYIYKYIQYKCVKNMYTLT